MGCHIDERDKEVGSRDVKHPEIWETWEILPNEEVSNTNTNSALVEKLDVDREMVPESTPGTFQLLEAV